MLCRLSINNYVLIDKLSIDLGQGFTALTGETGAGKSIIIGALGLVLGHRADTKCLGKKDQKCTIEAEFAISHYSLDQFFEQHDLDFFDQTILRREISPSGRSRAFVNDTPVNLGVLKKLCTHLIDIHSQHQSLLINKQDYQLNIIDSYSHHADMLQKYKQSFQTYISLNKELQQLEEKESVLKKEMDFKQFLFDEINQLNPTLENDSNIDHELNVIENFEEISDKLSQSIQLSETDDISIITLVNQLQVILKSISLDDDKLSKLTNRISSLFIEFKDCLYELNAINEQYSQDYDPKKLSFLRERSGHINKLLHKHSLQNVKQLIELKHTLEKELNSVQHLSDDIQKMKQTIAMHHKTAHDLSKRLSASRLEKLSNLEAEITQLTASLGMPNSVFTIKHELKSELSPSGIDQFTFLFSANKGMKPNEISKIASGGEISRLMLSFKYILAQKSCLTSILFDEIDTGVSGKIAHKMADLMKNMSTKMQVISISHLPQVAAKADTHVLVSKNESNNTTTTSLKVLNKEERVQELAKMLSGRSVTESSIKNAQDLLTI